MLTYTTLKDRPREFLAATGLTHEEFARLLPAFAAAYAALYPSDKTFEGTVRQRQVGGGAKGVLLQPADKYLTKSNFTFPCSVSTDYQQRAIKKLML